MDCLYEAQTIHRANFNHNTVQLATLSNIKPGACPEDCTYCAQSIHNNSGFQKEPLQSLETVLAEAKEAKANGATRFCMGAAWKQPTHRQLTSVIEMVKAVNALGLESCLSAGMLDAEKAQRLKDEAKLDYYNHNLDTSPEYYPNIATTRSYQDRLDTLKNISAAGIHTCCGGILGLGESRDDRVSFLHQLSTLTPHPKSVTINKLVPIPGTALENTPEIEDLEFVRVIAIARILMPQSFVRLSAGRESLSDASQALCFFAGANSMFYGDKLLTAGNAEMNEDLQLLNTLGMLADKKLKRPCQTPIPSTIKIATEHVL